MSEEEAMFGSEPKPTPTGSVTVTGIKNKPKINLTFLDFKNLAIHAAQ